MANYNALSVMNPAVDNIVSGKKVVEIRSWVPPSTPLFNLVLVQNEKYLNDGEEDLNAFALAMVDIVGFSEWTYNDFLLQNIETKINKKWKPGYYKWYLENVRVFNLALPCVAKKGIYEVSLKLEF